MTCFRFCQGTKILTLLSLSHQIIESMDFIRFIRLSRNFSHDNPDRQVGEMTSPAEGSKAFFKQLR
jgi:hypothetical protein